MPGGKGLKITKTQQKMSKVSLKHLNYAAIGTHWSILHGGLTEKISNNPKDGQKRK